MAKTVLIVDDSAFMRKVLKNILVEDGYKIVGEASTGKEAIKLYKKLKPDLVTMDIILRDESGIDVVKKINKVDKNAKIVMITALGQQQLAVEAIRAGAKEFIAKPFKKDRVLEAVKRLEV